MLRLRTTSFKNFLCLFYGLWISIAYFGIQYVANNRIDEVFSLGATISGLLLAIVYRRQTLDSAKHLSTWIRALCFGLSQIFLFQALGRGEVTAVFVSNSAAILVCFPLMRVVLKNRIEITEYIFGIGSAAAVLIYAPNFSVSFYGLLAGFFQGVSIVLIRKSRDESQSVFGNVAIGNILGGLIAAFFLRFNFSGTEPLYYPVVTSTFLILVSQLYFAWMAQSFSPALTSQISQTRIIWSMIIGALFLSKTPSPREMLGAGILAGLFLLRSQKVEKTS